MDNAWIVPKSVQEEMLRIGKPVVTFVLPGRDNPIGRDWIELNFGSLGIHGTNAPSSVYQFRSHGCIRLYPDELPRCMTTSKPAIAARLSMNRS